MPDTALEGRDSLAMDQRESSADCGATSLCPQPVEKKEWVLAAIILTISTALLNWTLVLHIDQRRTVAPELCEKYRELLDNNETLEFLRLLQQSTDSLREGKVYFRISNYDCPVTYLLAGGVMALTTGWPILLVHNLFFLIVFFLNGVCAYASLKSLGQDSRPALIGALLYQSSNYVFMSHYMGHMHCVQLQWIPLVFMSMFQMARRDSRLGWAALLGTVAGLQVLSSPYYTLYLGFVAVPVFSLVYFVGSSCRGSMTARDLVRFVGHAALAVGVAVLVSCFYLLPRLGSLPQHFTLPLWRPFALDHYLELLDPSDPALFIGLPMFVLSILSLRWWYHRPQLLTSAIVMTMGVSLLMMLPAVPGTPYWFFYHLIPLADRLRVPLRFFPVFHLMLIALATLYLNDVLRYHSPVRKWLVSAGVLVALLIFNWLASPWVTDFQLVPAVKGLLGRG